MSARFEAPECRARPLGRLATFFGRAIALIGLSAMLGAGAQASVPAQRALLEARVAAVRQALQLDEAGHEAPASGRVAQWGNWPNWANWPNWNNWNNWANWGNWFNR